MKEKYIDVHCHMLPGIDDGSRDLTMTEEMLRQAQEQGCCGIIVTPHYWKGRWEARPETVREAAKEVEALAKKRDPDFFVACGNEIKYYGSSMVEALMEKRCLTLGESKYVLVEFSYEITYSEIDMAINQLTTKGYRPIIAHIERYQSLYREYDRIDQLIQRGAYVQVNAGSIGGDEGMRIGGFVKKLLKYEMIHVIGSDAHNDKERAPKMERCAAYLKKKGGEECRRKLLYENPLQLLRNEYM